MTNFSAKIFNNAVSALNAQQAIIATTANNIANVNTEGYARRVASLETRIGAAAAGSLSIGNGVNVADISRVNDQYLENVSRNASSETEAYKIENDFLSRIEPLFNLNNERTTVGTAMTRFFDSLETLSINPASIELRTDVIERSRDLVESISEAYSTLADIQLEAEQRIEGEVDTINSITTQIAELNGLISQRETDGTQAADERDQRAILLDQLAEKISYERIEGADGMVTISLANGFPLVNGVISRDLEVTADPSFAGAGGTPPLLGGSRSKYVVFDYDPDAATTAHLDLTQTLSQNTGIMGGLLAVRGYSDPADTTAFQASGSVVEMGARIEAISRDLLTRFNARYLGPEAAADPTGNFDPSAVDLNGNNPAAFGFFDLGAGVTADNDADGIPEAADIDALVAAGTITNVSSLLELAIDAPEEIATGRDETNGTTVGEGDASNLTGTAALAGIIDLKTATTTFTSDSTNAFTRASVTYGELYNETVGRVGNIKARSDVNLSVSEDNYILSKNQREELSGVSLDEEFTNLIRFQKAFQANGRVLQIAEEMLDTLVGLL